jgi:hypothetical protein
LYEYCLKQFGQKKTEVLFFFTVNNNHHIIKGYIGSIGGRDQATVSIEDILRQAVVDNASSLVVAHNHPKGVTTMSNGDHNFYTILQTNAKILNISPIENIIFNETGYESNIFAPPADPTTHPKSKYIVFLIKSMQDVGAMVKSFGLLLTFIALIFMYIQINYGADVITVDYFLWLFFYPIGWVLEKFSNVLENMFGEER